MIFHVIGAHGVYSVEADNPEDAHKKCGYKFTGKFDSLGRFEIVRQPKGVYGAAPTWMIWDHRSKGKASDAYFTLKSVKEDLEKHANSVIASEVEYEFRRSQGQELKSYPDGSSFWTDGTQWTPGGN